MTWLIAQTQNIPFNIDVSTVVAGIATAALIGLATVITRNNRLLHKITFQVGSLQPPEGMIGEMHELKHEMNRVKDELRAIREWAISVGFERRHPYPPHKPE